MHKFIYALTPKTGFEEQLADPSFQGTAELYADQPKNIRGLLNDMEDCLGMRFNCTPDESNLPSLGSTSKKALGSIMIGEYTNYAAESTIKDLHIVVDELQPVSARAILTMPLNSTGRRNKAVVGTFAYGIDKVNYHGAERVRLVRKSTGKIALAPNPHFTAAAVTDPHARVFDVDSHSIINKQGMVGGNTI